MAVIIVTIAASLGMALAALPALAQAQTTIVPRTTIAVDERPMVVQPAPFGPAAPTASPAQTPTPTPEQRRRRDQQAQEQPVTAPTPAPVRPRAPGPRRPSNGYSSFLTGPIDLTRPPVPQQ